MLRTIATGHGCAAHGFDNEIRLCLDCDLAVTYPPYEHVEELYSKRNSNDFQIDDGIFAKWLKPFLFGVEAASLLKAIGHTPTVVADIGCGDGRFTLAAAHELNLSSKVYGVDFHDTPPMSIQADKSVTYLPMARMGELTGTCDLVILRHALEHTNDPVSLLTQLKDLLKPGGTICVEVPNRKSPWATIFGKHFDSWYTPYHRVHFSRKSLKTCLEHAGFAVTKELGSEGPKMGRSICNIFGTPYNNVFFALGVLLQPLQWAVSKISRQPVHLITIARK